MMVATQSVEELKQAIVEATRLLFGCGAMQHSGHGNLSARIDAERIVLTSRGSIRDLTAVGLAVVSLEGELLEGQIEPTAAEIVRMHTAVYRTRDSVGAVIHTHSPLVTAFALAHEPLPCAYEALLRFGVSEPIPVAAWGPRGSEASVKNIVHCLTTHLTSPAVLLANHGLLAFGRTPLETAQLIVAMEEAAGMTLGARQLGAEKPFPPGALEQERARMAQFGSAR